MCNCNENVDTDNCPKHILTTTGAQEECLQNFSEILNLLKTS